jgi:CubicO group peptidase (beta-lactamase class C family)
MKTVTTALTAVFAWALMGIANSQPGTVFPQADWQEASPESQGVDSAKLKAAVAYMHESFGADGARELVIVRNGYLIWKGPDSDAYHELYSATKVFTSTILGLLVGDGKCALDTLAVEHLPDLDDRYPAYAKIRLRHLASVTGGYHGKVANVTPGQEWGDPIVYVTTPDTPEFEPAGSQVAYNDHDVHLLGRILATRAAHEPLKDLFQRRIADPIGMSRWDWGACGTVDGMVHYNAAGTPALKGNGGVQTTPQELARLGHLYLNRGRWKGKQLLSASFVDEATTSQVPATLPGRSSSLLSGAYGFYWWTNGVMANGNRRWPAAPPKTYAAQGASTNFCFIIPEWNMVVVRMGNSDLPGSFAQQDRLQDTFFAKVADALGVASHAGRPADRSTEVSIHGDAFYINGRPTYEGRTWQGHKIEGLLLNSRMVQGIFDDLNPDTCRLWAYPDTGRWDPERNTREFIAAMPEWRRHGLLAFTLNLQGGDPCGSVSEQPLHNSALTETGELRPDYMARLERILDRADELGMVAILGVFYFGQDQRLKDEAAVVHALDNAVDWVLDHDYRNVLIEVNNECDVAYDHPVLQPERVHELLGRAKSRQRNGRRLLVSTSYGGGTVPRENVVRVADFLLVHGNGVDDPRDIAEMARRTRRVPGYRAMPILFNEDDHFDFDQPRNNLLAAVADHCSWGYLDVGANNYVDGYQAPPVNWGINTGRKQAFFAKVREIAVE